MNAHNRRISARQALQSLNGATSVKAATGKTYFVLGKENPSKEYPEGHKAKCVLVLRGDKRKVNYPVKLLKF